MTLTTVCGFNNTPNHQPHSSEESKASKAKIINLYSKIIHYVDNQKTISHFMQINSMLRVNQTKDNDKDK